MANKRSRQLIRLVYGKHWYKPWLRDALRNFFLRNYFGVHTIEEFCKHL